MTEIENIQQHNNGEIPNGKYDIICIKNIENPEQELTDLKETVMIILENIELDAENEEWLHILPNKIVKFTEQLKDEDYYRDDLITNIPNIVWGFQNKNLKEWTWYSSKLKANGFEIVMKGVFRAPRVPLIHHHGIPQSSIFLIRDGIEYPTKALEGVLTYRKWNPDTLELK